MPGLSFTLPHWLYWVGLIVFPAIAMILARRTRPAERLYSKTLAYMILVAGGIIGLHRFYLKSILGLIFIPVFVFVLYSNSSEQYARTQQTDIANQLRMAERIVAREKPRISDAEAALGGLRDTLAATEEGTFARRSAEKKVTRAENTIETGRNNLREAQARVAETTPMAAVASEKRAFWSRAAGWAFYVLLALVAIDAFLIPGLVRRANDTIEEEPVVPNAIDPDSRQPDPAYATNVIDRISLFCGEFVSYWAVIAVFVYYYEVIARYVFNSPTNWAHESMYLMFGMQYLIAGSYAMLTESHVRVDIFYANFSPRRRAVTDLLTSVFFFIFAGTLMVTSWIFAMDAIAVPAGNGVLSAWARGEIPTGEMLSRFDLAQFTDPAIRWGETSFNEWEVPLWPMKWVMVLGGLLLILQGISKVGKDIRTIVRG